MNWHQVAADCHAIAEANGFDAPTWENFLGKTMFVVTELEEARHATTLDGDGNLSEELADVAIRLLDMLHTLSGGDWHVRPPSEAAERWLPFATAAWPVLTELCNAVEYWRDDKRGDALICLELALKHTRHLALIAGVDLESAILAKCEKNRSRPVRHGRVRSDG